MPKTRREDLSKWVQLSYKSSFRRSLLFNVGPESTQTSCLPGMQETLEPFHSSCEFSFSNKNSQGIITKLKSSFIAFGSMLGLAGTEGENKRKKTSSQVMQLRMQFQQLYSVGWGGLCALGGGEAVAIKGAAVIWRRFPGLGSPGKCWITSSNPALF